MASGSHSVLKTPHSRKYVRDSVEGQENGEKDTVAGTMGNREPGQEAVVMVQVTIRKAKAEVNFVLFTGGENEAQNEPGWRFRFLAFLSVIGTPDLVCNPNRKCGFFLLCPTATHTALGGQWSWGPLRRDSVQEPQEENIQTKVLEELRL